MNIKYKYVKLILWLVLTLGLLFVSIFLLNDNYSKSQVISDLQSKIDDLEFDNSMYKQATATDFIDYKKGSGIVDAAFLYQDEEIVSRHGIAIIIDNQFYRVGVDPDNNIFLSNHSKITSIENNKVEFEYILDDKTTKFLLTVNLEENSVNFKLDEMK